MSALPRKRRRRPRRRRASQVILVLADRTSVSSPKQIASSGARRGQEPSFAGVIVDGCLWEQGTVRLRGRLHSRRCDDYDGGRSREWLRARGRINPWRPITALRSTVLRFRVRNQVMDFDHCSTRGSLSPSFRRSSADEWSSYVRTGHSLRRTLGLLWHGSPRPWPTGLRPG
jgi:hypothetical protein